MLFLGLRLSPLYVVRNRWVDGVQFEFEQKKDVAAYLTDLKATLRAKENARKAQINYKKYLDRKSSERKLNPG